MAGKIELRAPLDGIVSIVPEDTASDFTVTIPAVTGELLNDQSDIETQVKAATNASGSAPIYACRAWVNFDGDAGSGNTIRGSGNVSSVTRNGTGDYTVNFTTTMPDANYSTQVSNIGSTVANVNCYAHGISAVSTSSVRFIVRNAPLNAPTNNDSVNVTVFR